MPDLLELVDEGVGGRVLVFGSLPPEGRDLDLLAREPEEHRLRAVLDGLGFAQDGRRQFRFVACTAEVVELVPAADWCLDDAEVEALFGEAVPLERARHLALPAPHHSLLIEARKAAWSGGVLNDRARRRVERALADDTGALQAARRAAPAWNASAALKLLERARVGRRRVPRRTVARAVGELAARDGRAGGWGPAARAVIPGRPRRGSLIAFSGLDGSGKSSQTAALRDALDRLGYDAVVEWSSLSQHPPFLHALTGAAERFLRPARRRGVGAPERPNQPATAALRERSTFVTFAWSTLVALTNALEQSRAVNRHLWRGRVVICDRYTLDSRVHLRFAYGERVRFAWQAAMIKLISPKPDRAYLLEVSAETATGRKQDYSLVDNERRARLYREERARLGVIAVDGEQPREEICRLVAEDVLEVLAA